jgi:hypothetical protein
MAGPAFGRRFRGLRVGRIRVPFQALALVAGLPAALGSLLRSRSDCWRTRRASFAPTRSFEVGVPESALSIDSRRSSSASLSSSRRLSSRSASNSWWSPAFSVSFVSATARNRDNSSRCSAITPARPGSSGTRTKHAQSELEIQTPTRRRRVAKDPANSVPKPFAEIRRVTGN